jgi:hypothetical protein
VGEVLIGLDLEEEVRRCQVGVLTREILEMTHIGGMIEAETRIKEPIKDQEMIQEIVEVIIEIETLEEEMMIDIEAVMKVVIGRVELTKIMMTGLIQSTLVQVMLVELVEVMIEEPIETFHKVLGSKIPPHQHHLQEHHHHYQL